ncbi:hypothetical protein T484DRAFT_1787555 [Baffinella frigidus]|nr:hypothetical protein T484DRAFT_1787555 [Cryptophyta sp. CCMP2293]
MGNSQDKPFMPGCCEEESRGKLRVFVDKNRSTGAAESPTDVRNSFVGRHSAYGGGSSPTRNSPQRVGGNVFTSSVGSSPWTARTPRDAAPAEETSMCDCGTPRNSREEKERKKSVLVHRQQSQEAEQLSQGPPMPEEKERKKAFVVQRQQRQEAELLSPGSHCLSPKP